uniref:PLOD1-3-like GT domain-containing protein n=1 Tax=Neospora caninum (strain Liverpool) TaxID=572307 RepID=A0A0F7U8I8_NEOCL|nr:TPA: hypothetical protein BN1204_007740 [Neospora caninum Liverpool]
MIGMGPSSRASFPSDSSPVAPPTVDVPSLMDPYPASLPPLHILSVTTHRNGYFTSLVYSSTLLGADLRVFGWGQKWHGFGSKMMAMVAFSRSRDPGEIVMIVDGFDTVLLQPKEAIARKFLEFGNRIVVTGEATMHRWGFFKHLFRLYHDCIFRASGDNKWPKPLPYASPNLRLTLVNAGAFIGFAGDIVRLFQNIDCDTNDQKFLGDLYRADPYKDVVIDHNCAIFALYRRDLKFLSFEEAEKHARHVVPYFEEGSPSKKYPPAPAVMRTALRGAVLDARTNEAPCVLHIHCRRNADWLMKLLGLPCGEDVTDFRSYVWYAFFSLKGTIGADRQVARVWGTVLFTTIVTCISIFGLGVVLLGWCARQAASHNLPAWLSENGVQPILNFLLQLYMLSKWSHVFTPLAKGDWAASQDDPFGQQPWPLPHITANDGGEVIPKAQGGDASVLVNSGLLLGHLVLAAVAELGVFILRVVSWVVEVAIRLRWVFLGGAIVGITILTGMTLIVVGLNVDGENDDGSGQATKDSNSLKKKVRDGSPRTHQRHFVRERQMHQTARVDQHL